MGIGDCGAGPTGLGAWFHAAVEQAHAPRQEAATTHHLQQGQAPNHRETC